MGKGWEIAIAVIFGEFLVAKLYLLKRSHSYFYIHTVSVIGIVISALVFVRMRRRRTQTTSALDRPIEDEEEMARRQRYYMREMTVLTPVRNNIHNDPLMSRLICNLFVASSCCVAVDGTASFDTL